MRAPAKMPSMTRTRRGRSSVGGPCAEAASSGARSSAARAHWGRGGTCTVSLGAPPHAMPMITTWRRLRCRVLLGLELLDAGLEVGHTGLEPRLALGDGP